MDSSYTEAFELKLYVEINIKNYHRTTISKKRKGTNSCDNKQKQLAAERINLRRDLCFRRCISVEFNIKCILPKKQLLFTVMG